MKTRIDFQEPEYSIKTVIEQVNSLEVLFSNIVLTLQETNDFNSEAGKAQAIGFYIRLKETEETYRKILYFLNDELNRERKGLEGGYYE